MTSLIVIQRGEILARTGEIQKRLLEKKCKDGSEIKRESVRLL